MATMLLFSDAVTSAYKDTSKALKEVDLSEGLIVAKRHIHMTSKDAEEFGVNNGDIVKVKIEDTGRSLVFDDVVIRVSDKYSLAMHIDTDESNAAACSGEVFGTLIKD